MKLTWTAAAPQLVEQSQALLLRPVMDDSGQDVQVGGRNLLLEEITYRAQWNSRVLVPNWWSLIKSGLKFVPEKETGVLTL